MIFKVHVVFDPEALVLELRTFPGVDESSVCLLRTYVKEGFSQYGLALDEAIARLRNHQGVKSVTFLSYATFQVETEPETMITELLS